ncbi:MATE family efflux transporter [Halobaculum sp. CBA1158]|uniref:MATE family efflux transporter n=1 Tax=Halobaculum sp. CBA1158 TaxID=2904243 RepID=UPI001F4496EB|nr:MATE family efflux transporter [Halobaculum sp. CBA1158]UIO99813.1 MATE family efflux transporter [Halobaculum sp. CBA1158]
MLDVSTEEITEGRLGRALAFLSIPIVAQQLAVVAQSVVDVLWLGRLSGEAVAAVGLVAPLIGLMTAVTGGVFTGEHVLVSQRVGEGDERGASRAVFHALVAAVAVMLAMVAITGVFGRQLTSLFDPGPEVVALGAVYLATMAIAYTVSAVSDVFEYGFIGAGDSRTPLFVNLLSIGISVGLDPILIFGFVDNPLFGMLGLGGLESSLYAATGYAGSGIAGAAYATAVGFGVGALVMIAAALSSRRGFTFHLDAAGLDLDEFRELVEVGAPKAGQSAARQVARLIVVAIVSFAGGAAALTAYTVGARIATVVFVPAAAIGSAGTTLVGQNLGADRPDRATRATWLGVGVGTVGLGSLGIVQYLVPELIATAFVPGIGGEALTLTVAYLQILAFGYWALGAIWTVEAGFNGAGRTDVSMYSTMLQYWAVRVPVAAVGAYVLGWGALGPFWAITASNVVAAVGLVGYFRYSTGRGLHERAAEDAGGDAGDGATAADD